MSESFNPWTGLWLAPRKTIRAILNTDPTYLVIALAAGIGALSGIQEVSILSYDPEFQDTSSTAFLVGGAIGGAIGGVIFLYLFGWLTKVVAGWLGGDSTSQSMRAVNAWSSVPTAVTAIVAVVIYTLLDLESALIIVGVVSFVIGIWQIVIFSMMAGEANNFSAWRGFGTLLLTVLIFLVTVLVLVFAVALMAAALGIAA